MVPAGNNAKRLLLVNHTTKIIHHHHTSALKLLDEFNANFVLLCYSGYSSIKMIPF